MGKKSKTKFRITTVALVLCFSLAVVTVIFGIFCDPKMKTYPWLRSLFLFELSAFVVFCAMDALMCGRVFGQFFDGSRKKSPVSFWFTIVGAFVFAIAMTILGIIKL